jgi:hypothetical protein
VREFAARRRISVQLRALEEPLLAGRLMVRRVDRHRQALACIF